MESKLAIKPLVNRLTAAVPLYNQIAESLLDQIESGKLAPGSRLPPERELSEMLGVNRMTLRQALHLLQTQGLLIRRQGNGTFVADPKIERQAGRLISFTRGMERRGLKPGARVVSHQFGMGEWAPDKTLDVRTSLLGMYGEMWNEFKGNSDVPDFDNTGSRASHDVISTWVVPAPVAGVWRGKLPPESGGGEL